MPVNNENDLLAQIAAEQKRTSDLNPLDLEDGRRRVRSILKTREGREALRREMGYNFQFADEVMADARPLVILIVPTRSMYTPQTSKAVNDMLLASQGHCIVNSPPGISMSVVHWARNDLLIRLRKSGQPADFVLMMDDDMVPPPDALIKLLAHMQGEHPVDIVAGACTVRQDPPIPNYRVWVPELLTYRPAFQWKGQNGNDNEGLLEVAAVGAAFMLIRTTVLDKIGEYTLSCRYEREHIGMPAELADKIEQGRRKHAAETGNEWWFEFLKHPWGDGEYGEDISFCFKARACGFPVFVDTTVRPGHVGSYAFGIDDYLSYQQEVLAREAAKEQRAIKIQARIEEEVTA
jgi:hypothetical protein